MPKIQTRFVCQECGRISARMMGRCPQCGAYGSMVEEVISTATEPSRSTGRGLGGDSQPQRLTDIKGEVEERMPLPIGEFARVLGGGVVPGSIVLVGGDPGIGKSTLMLQVAMEMTRRSTVLYISGEESERQIKMRALRLLRLDNGAAQDDGSAGAAQEMPKQLFLVTETNLERILEHIAAVKPDLVIVDSIQTVYIPEISSTAGSVTQVRECSGRLRELAKASGIAVFVIGHVTKEGIIAGPRVLEHIVDTVLYLEGDRFQTFRLLRSVKNRFGATSEVGVFEMQEHGMVEVTNPSEAFLAERMVNTPGSAIAVTMEGTRPLLVEVQGLTSASNLGNPRRTPNGLDFNRLLLITAVLGRRLGVNLSDQDVFVNIVGGLRVTEPAADLAVAAAIASSMRDIPVRADTVLIGEVGLSGELRWVGHMNTRLNEAAKLGFKAAIVPRKIRRGGEPWPAGIQIIEARSLREALGLSMISEKCDSPSSVGYDSPRTEGHESPRTEGHESPRTEG
jgi:DNA repair protein RadA/Sms